MKGIRISMKRYIMKERRDIKREGIRSEVANVSEK